MNSPMRIPLTLIAAAAGAALLAACAATPTRPPGAAEARARLTQLQSDPQLASRAPVAIKDAEAAVSAAEQPRDDAELSRHLVFLADRKVEIASAQAHSRLLEDQRKTLSEQREAARLESRTQEADRAHRDASNARSDAAYQRSEAELARSQTDAAHAQTDAANQQADAARQATAAAQAQSDDLQRQVAELNAKATDRGLVVTLGDLLFATGKSDLRGNAASNLGKLSAFLLKYPDRTVAIEGHTDNVGGANANLALSQRRADSVKSYLVAQGVAPARVTSTGMGETAPVAGNDSFTGRQQNRRVEVIISNTVTSSR